VFNTLFRGAEEYSIDMATPTNAEFDRKRSSFTNAILTSKSPKKLIVAGPGTGKTHTFSELLELNPGKNLAVTFLKSLVADLTEKLGEMSDVHSFHGFCKEILHKFQPTGISANFEYYPPLFTLIAEDLSIAGTTTTVKQLEAEYLNLVDPSELIEHSIQLSNYYDTVGYTDSVYRVLRLLQEKRVFIPKYNQIVVDEFQDFSELEVTLIKLLAEKSNILIAGDDDQALYGFKHASAKHIRDLAEDSEYEQFDLPYCTRCTEIVVKAVRHLVGLDAVKQILVDRLPKDYFCYLPDKQSDSDKYPKIINAECSVEQSNAPFMSRFIHEQILKVPKEEIAESHDEGYPTVLVIAPKHIAKRISTYLENYFKNVEFKESAKLAVELLDGYKLLIKNPTSRLGWRIIIHSSHPPRCAQIIKSIVSNGSELVGLLPKDYVDFHENISTLVSKVVNGESIDTQETLLLEKTLQMTFLEIKEKLVEEEPGADEEILTDEAQEQVEAPVDKREPKIMITTMVGSKGLQAGHVFISGVNEGSFPKKNSSPTNDEVCQLIVALTRTKKCCYLVSTQRFAGRQTRKSIFVDWLSPLTETIMINSSYYK